MKKYLIWLLLALIATPVLAGHNNEAHFTMENHLWSEVRMSLDDAVRTGRVKPYSDFYYVGGGVDPRYAGTRQPLGAGGIRDMRTDLWGGAGSILVNAYTDASGYGVYLTRADEYGDSISIYVHAYAAKLGDTRELAGVTCGARPADWIQLACGQYTQVAPIRDAPATGSNDMCSPGGGGKLWGIDSSTVQSADSVVLNHSWYYNVEIAADDSCKLEVKRRIRMHRADPYALVRYSVRSTDMNNGANAVAGDSIRFIWKDELTLGDTGSLTGGGVRYDLGYMWEYGEAPRQVLFTDPEYPVAIMTNIGNPLATTDSLADGTHARDNAADSLFENHGSGTGRITGTFIAFNPNGETPTEIIYISGDESQLPAIAYDSTLIAQHDDAEAFNYDSTTVVGQTPSISRCVFMRTEPVYLDTVAYSVFEYAIGTVRFSDNSTPYWPAVPRIRFTDGTVLAIPYHRKR